MVSGDLVAQKAGNIILLSHGMMFWSCGCLILTDDLGNSTDMSEMFCTNRVEFTQLAADYKAVNLGQGFPDFSPPKYVQEAFCKAVNGGPLMHQYTRGFVSDTWYLSVNVTKACYFFSSSYNVFSCFRYYKDKWSCRTVRETLCFHVISFRRATPLL